MSAPMIAMTTTVSTAQTPPGACIPDLTRLPVAGGAAFGGAPFEGDSLAAAIIAAARSRPASDGSLSLPNGAVLCDPAALEEQLLRARTVLLRWLSEQEPAIAAASLASPLKISAGVIRAAVATLEEAIDPCRDLRDDGHALILIDLRPVREEASTRPGLLVRAVAAAARHAATRPLVRRARA